MRSWIALLLILIVAVAPERAAACSVCFGDPTSPAAQGLAMGVIALLGVVFFVLSGFTVFFIYIARRASAAEASMPSDTTNQSDPL